MRLVSSAEFPDLLPVGCRLGGIGGFRPVMCEYDTELLSKASKFVESRET